MKYELELPLPPSVNVIYGWNPRIHQKFYKSDAKNYLAINTMVVKSFVNKNKIIPFSNYFYLDMYFWLPRQNSDSHNFLKLLMDVLEHGTLVENDKWIMNRTQEIKVEKENPRVLMKFEQ